MIGAFTGFAQNTASNFANNPWGAVGILDDVLGAKNIPLLFPLVAYSAGKAQRGETLPELASGVAGLSTMPMMTSLTAGALRLIAPSLGGPVSFIAVNVAAILLSNKPNDWLRSSVFRKVRALSTFDRETRRLEMGGQYQDNQTNRAFRSAAIQEMSSAFQNSRSYLGREALFLHR